MSKRSSLWISVLCGATGLWSVPLHAETWTPQRLQNLSCTSVTERMISTLATQDLGTPEVQALRNRIMTCFSSDEMRSFYLDKMKIIDRERVAQVDNVRNSVATQTSDDDQKARSYKQEIDQIKHLPPPLNKTEKSDRIARVSALRQSITQLPVRYRIDLDPAVMGLQGDVAMSQVQQIEGMSCGEIRGQVQCAPECKIFLGMNTSGMPPDYIKRTSGKELKDWTDPDFDTFHKNFITCHANSPREMFAPEIQEGAFSSFIDQKTDQLRRQRDALKGGEMETASLPAECQADINALSGKQSDIALEIARVGTDIDQLFAAGAHDEACQKLDGLSRKLENTRSSMMRCRDNDTIKTSSHYPPILFLKGATAFNQAEETFTRYGQTKGCD